MIVSFQQNSHSGDMNKGKERRVKFVIAGENPAKPL